MFPNPSVNHTYSSNTAYVVDTGVLYTFNNFVSSSFTNLLSIAGS